ncbi:MAG: hypothetical protein ACIAXF_16590 [Phycisphaerales bacterium JB063]
MPVYNIPFEVFCAGFVFGLAIVSVFTAMLLRLSFGLYIRSVAATDAEEPSFSQSWGFMVLEGVVEQVVFLVVGLIVETLVLAPDTPVVSRYITASLFMLPIGFGIFVALLRMVLKVPVSDGFYIAAFYYIIVLAIMGLFYLGWRVLYGS